MLFNSIEFFFFFPIVTIIFFLLPHRYRWIWLLAASCYFYMYLIPVYIFILFFTILIDYVAGIQIERSVGKRRKAYLIISIVATCLILFVFKYFNFFNNAIEDLAHLIGASYSKSYIEIILPVGLSFHTFQSLSYVIEVYRGNQKAERNFGIYSLYVMFYPQLVAGPIERPQNLLHQFYEKKYFDYERVREGLQFILWGLFKKMVIADRLALIVNKIYDHPYNHTAISLLIATIFFAFQIYCDFSGYSDIALGTARVMGFKLMKNFDRPYSARSLSEFWKRWHISLSTWFRDYVYIPLGGNRTKKWKWYYNLTITFIISGLWHGANWTFLAWGLFHGVFLVIELIIKRIIKKSKMISSFYNTKVIGKVRVVVVFGLVCIGWIFFRAATLKEALYIIKTICTYTYQNIVSIIAKPKFINDFLPFFYKNEKIELLLSLMALITFFIIERKRNISLFLINKTIINRWITYLFLTLSIIFLGRFGNEEFIYFQF